MGFRRGRLNAAWITAATRLRSPPACQILLCITNERAEFMKLRSLVFQPPTAKRAEAAPGRCPRTATSCLLQ
jgi:hypothetical protein